MHHQRVFAGGYDCSINLFISLLHIFILDSLITFFLIRQAVSTLGKTWEMQKSIEKGKNNNPQSHNSK